MGLRIVYPHLPPSSNHIYVRGTILKKEARIYAEDFAKYVAQNYMPEILKLNPNGIYSISIMFFFETVENATFNNFNIPESKRAKSRYKKFDLTNRVKLLEDCIRDAIDIDDSRTFVASQEKHQDPKNPRVVIDIEEVSPVLFGLLP